MVFGLQKDGVSEENLSIEIFAVDLRDRWPFMSISQDAAW